MIERIEFFMKVNVVRIVKCVILLFYILSFVYFVYFAVPYILHDTTMTGMNSMLPAEKWDNAGWALTIGFVPIVFINVCAFCVSKFQNLYIRLLYFIPSIISLIIVISYWVTTFFFD